MIEKQEAMLARLALEIQYYRLQRGVKENLVSENQPASVPFKVLEQNSLLASRGKVIAEALTRSQADFDLTEAPKNLERSQEAFERSLLQKL